MVGSDEDHGRNKRPGAVVQGRFVSSLASKPRSTVCQWFGLGTTGTIFSDLTSKQVVMVSPSLTSIPVGGFFVEPQNQGGRGFSGLGLKTGSYGLMIWTSKSPQQFFGLVFKTKQTLACRLRHKTDGKAMA
jgi:hypothetical protein